MSAADKTEMSWYRISWYKNGSQFENLDDKTEIVITNAKEQGETNFTFILILKYFCSAVR